VLALGSRFFSSGKEFITTPSGLQYRDEVVSLTVQQCIANLRRGMPNATISTNHANNIKFTAVSAIVPDIMNAAALLVGRHRPQSK
jgi:TctA family transporter